MGMIGISRAERRLVCITMVYCGLLDRMYLTLVARSLKSLCRPLESHYHVVGRQFQCAILRSDGIVSQCEPYSSTLGAYQTERKGEGGTILADSVSTAEEGGELDHAFRGVALDE